jgi:trk system potassium uptake protein
MEASLKDKFYPKTKGLGFRILVIYIALTIAEIILLVLGDMNLFDSICHTFGTIATGGFSTKNTSLQYYSAYSQYVVMIFMFLSGVSLVIYYYIINLNFKKVKQNDEFWFYGLFTLIAGTLATLILLKYTNAPLEAAFRNGFFNVISVITTTGFASSDFVLWPVPGLMLIFILYFAGASTGSTTGAIKMGRHLILLKNLKNFFVRLSHPHIVPNINYNGKPLTSTASFTTITFVLLYLLVFLIGTLALIVTGSDPVTSASAVAASLGNVGPGLATVGPFSNYAHLPQASKLILSLLMIIGRLEIYTVFVIFSRSFWKP